MAGIGEPTASLHSHLASEERRVRATYPFDGRFALLELARAMDVYFVSNKLSADDVDEKRHAFTQLYEFGWTRALSIFIDESASNDGPAPLFPSDRGSANWSHGIIQHCGRIALTDHLLDCVRYGLMRLEQRTDTEFLFRYEDGPRDLEALDWGDFIWLISEIAKSEESALSKLDCLEPEMRVHLSRSVWRFKDHYIGYDAVPELDEFFEAKGVLAAHRCLGQDSFHGDTLFGGNPFNLYRAAVGVLMGWALKHQAFCAALLEQHPDLLVPNLLTIHAPLDNLEEWLAAQLEIGVEQARVALDVVTLSFANRTAHMKAGPFPSLVAVGRRHVIQSFAGTMGQPFFFMLRELRRRFRADWDRAVDEREALFRWDLHQIFGPLGLALLVREKKIRIDNRTATDVDAAFADLRNGVLGLFQLKWQDWFGGSMCERESRKKNLLEGGNRWIATMKEWLKDRSAEKAGRDLGLPPEAASRLKSVRLFVLGRAFASFSGTAVREPGAAWGNWAQLCRLTVESAQEFVENPIDHLFRRFERDRVADATPKRALPGRIELPLGQLKVVVET